MSDAVPIQSRDFWVKVVEMLQQNWALIEPGGDQVTVYFLHDLGGVFDEIPYGSLRDAQAALRLNGFRRFDEDPSYAEMFALPAGRAPQWSDLLLRRVLGFAVSVLVAIARRGLT
jgi:hypothetical protein